MILVEIVSRCGRYHMCVDTIRSTVHVIVLSWFISLAQLRLLLFTQINPNWYCLWDKLLWNRLKVPFFMFMPLLGFSTILQGDQNTLRLAHFPPPPSQDCVWALYYTNEVALENRKDNPSIKGARSDSFRFFSKFWRFWYQKKAHNIIFLITPGEFYS